MRPGVVRPKLRAMTTVLPPIRDFAGEVLMPGDAAFEEARRVHNAAVDHVPALIARCAGAHDVASALRHARERGLPVTVRGGGHAPGGFAVGDGALVIDLTRMRAVYVDPARRCARVQGGATWRELDAATQAHGLAVTGARMPSVGVAGFTLGSGSGWLERKLGLAGDALRSARVVTADGDVVTASEDEHADLFWALRGGGSGFGVVVELEFALQPVGPLVTGGLLGWRAERTVELAQAYAALMAGAPDDLGGGLALVSAPPAPFVPDDLQGRPIAAIAVLWTGDAEEGEALIQPLRELGARVRRGRPAAVHRVPGAARAAGQDDDPQPPGGRLPVRAGRRRRRRAGRARRAQAVTDEQRDPPAAGRRVRARSRGRDAARAARRAVDVAGGRRLVRTRRRPCVARVDGRAAPRAGAVLGRGGVPELPCRRRSRAAARGLLG